jgi:adenosine kinase
MAALGNDGADYTARLGGWGVDTSLVRHDHSTYTAQAIIITDRDNNQITAFHPGAMTNAHLMQVPPAAEQARLEDRHHRARRPRSHAAARHADARRRHPLCLRPRPGPADVRRHRAAHFVDMATWVAVNDYEGRMLCERTGLTLESLSRRTCKGVIVTLGAGGCDLWVQGEHTHVPGQTATEVLDPTGCGDAFRGGLLYGLERGWSLQRSVALGNRMGALKIACRGGQNHQSTHARAGRTGGLNAACQDKGRPGALFHG